MMSIFAGFLLTIIEGVMPKCSFIWDLTSKLLGRFKEGSCMGES